MPPRPVAVETVTTIDAGTGGLSVDEMGRIYSADFGAVLGDQDTMGRVIHRINPADGSSTVFASGLEGASGNRFGPDGCLYQSNIRGNRITAFDANGEPTTQFAELIAGPVGVAFDRQGRLLVANCGSQSVARFDGRRASIIAESSLFRCPNGITVASDGLIYVANFYDGKVLRIDDNGNVSPLAELPGENNGHLTACGDGLLVVARGSHSIYRVELDGAVSCWLGTGEAGHTDGDPRSAQLNYPNAIAVDLERSTVYVNEVAITTDGMTLAPTRVRKVVVD